MSDKRKRKDSKKQKNLNPMNNRKKVGILLFATSIVLFFLFVARFSYIVVKGEIAGTSLEEKTKSLYQGSEVIKAKRGTIYDRNGIAIAEDATSYSIRATLEKTFVSGKDKLYAEEKNFDAIAEILHKYLKIKKSDALDTLKTGLAENKYQVEFGSFGKNISLATKQKIENEMSKQKMAGLYFNEHPARMYPNGIFSSHLIGYAVPNEDDNGLEGKLGIEQIYDDVLSGTDGKRVFQKDNAQNPLAGTVAEETPAVDGKDIYTTLDSRLQTMLETSMDEVYKNVEPESLTAMLVQAKTGDIVAMGQRPTFDPENLDAIEVWRNFLVEDQYEPGSTMKLFTTAAALDEGVFNENETFTSGKITVADTDIYDHDKGAKGDLTMRQALSWSSNVGMVKLEQKLGDNWPRYMKILGLGQSTHSGLNVESAGQLPTDNVVDQAMSSFGQAVNVTNFQMMRGFTAIANNGTMLQPHYISKIVDTQTGKETVTKTEVVGHPFQAESTQKVREYMRDVVEDPNYGSAYGLYSVPGYNVAAKTGTAQIASEQGGYIEGENPYLFSIVEMVPAEDPEYILYLTMKLPKNYDREALPSIANPLMKRAMEFNEDSTDDIANEETEKVKVSDYRNLGTEEAASDAQKKNLTPVVIGDGKKIVKQSTPNGEELMASEKLILLTDGSKVMPDVTGWSKGDLLKLANLLGVEAVFEGDGYCKEQSVVAYDIVTTDKLHFVLE
ncbi:penicillin-binding protein 2X [Enterococcus phoeniculicola]|jgi:penicillin-binding protein 2X|uniref:Penicillin-binding protein 2X n=1 Tax=Enterococcus phoeniculicola ATCC BAA-412 TaxID=1158610 RepID=R3WND2_9ENTE|nr:penicillin-binding transpeptidase domain-containing protein [Enterococcus phoeniculicola]EOL48932.1 penicillin-binding protein 2X [Enterococcus phoeniculicola ATCC BAA-412]EOT72778.1 penicillin-binding protein 2X [Enterococcus phoeniculicola ATCC BAA-412]OJG70825.1 penicillin-binding protein 2X [Enterococcus phoeniculicola]